MASPLLYAAESWEKVYKAFEEVNFTAYDYDAVKQSLLDYLKFHYPENFNDYVEASQMIALIEMFAYVAELYSYRNDISKHEVLWPTVSRKQNILRLAKFISYTASRNIPLRGLVKITSVSISEDVRDSLGNSLSNRVIKWADPSNPLWKEQFFAVFNKTLVQQFGAPFKSFQIDDTVFQQYQIQNILESENERSSFRNGVLKFKLTVNGSDYQFELVPGDVDQAGIFERSPNLNAYFSILYGDDGHGDGSDTTGFMMYLKQGVMQKLVHIFDSPLPNRQLDVNIPNVNDVDVWVQQVDEQGVITKEWTNVPNVEGVNLAFNTLEARTKYEIETLEDDRIRLIFGDGDFSDIPTGIFNVWVRQSNSGSITVSKNQIAEQSVTFLYTSKLGKQESCTFTFSLVSALQNSAPSEDIEHIRKAAPAVYYTQNRMVNGEDYNSFFLKDPSILRLRSINRTFAGQPKYIEWNDASGAFQNVKIFGNDARLYYDIAGAGTISTTSARSLIDEVIEPMLSTPGIYNLLVYSFYKSATPLNLAFIRPRTLFIEDSDQTIAGLPFQEKTVIQGALDRHWYGEPDSMVLLNSSLSETGPGAKSPYGIVNGDTDQRIYDQNLKMVTGTSGSYALVGTPGGVSGVQEAVIRQKRFGIRFVPDRGFVSNLRINPASTDPGAIPNVDNLSNLDINQSTATVETYTVEIVDEEGTFTVYSSTRGEQIPGIVGEAYDNGVISFLIGFPPSVDETITIGDSFIINITIFENKYIPQVFKKNLTGYFTLIDESLLPLNATDLSYDPNDPIKSWIMIIERTDNEDGSLAYWNVIGRNFNLIIESPTTRFWYNNDNLTLVDPDTKKPVKDAMRILKSNLDVTRTQAIGKDQVYDVVGDVRYPDGEVNFNSLSISPRTFVGEHFSGDGAVENPLEFLRLIGDTDYVYFREDPTNNRLVPVVTTEYLESLTYTNDVSGEYVRRLGRNNIDFMWQHFTPDDHLIDPSPSNIIDTFVLTRGYYSRVVNYLRGLEPVEPTPPTSLELRNTYRTLIENKMISDTVVMHSGKMKLILGTLAEPELRAKFRIIMAPGAKLVADQVRARVLDIVEDYFSIDNWDFGQNFYATELCAVIHKTLATEISSVVLVPEFPTNYFGDLFFLRSAPDEIFHSCAKLENIEVVQGLDHLTLKQRP